MRTPEAEHGLGDIRRGILRCIKIKGSATIAELSKELAVSYEATRLHIAQMRSEGWIERRTLRASRPSAGRPNSLYRLTRDGEHLFPKFYDLLSIELIDAVVGRFGMEGLRSILADLAEKRVQDWRQRLSGLSLEEKLEALKDIYLVEDPNTRVEKENGELRLVEYNCPFLNVALEQPALCSLTVTTLSSLLGRRVVREKQFQKGDGRCVFRVMAEDPLPAEGFRFESED